MSHAATCDLEDHLHKAGVPRDADRDGAVVEDRRLPRAGGWRSVLGVSELRWALGALACFLLGLGFRAASAGIAADALFGACYVAGGWEPGLAGLQALRRRSLDVDLLMVVAALVAAGIGQVFDGALLIVIFSTSGALEAVSTRRTREAVRSLLRLTPEQANRLESDGSERTVAAADLVAGDAIFVRPGERLPADGIVVDGASDVDQASITGEPLPADKAIGDEVFAGTLNGSGALRVEVTRAASESVVARIVSLVEEASETKARTQLFIDRVEQRYSLGMVAVTAALFVLPLLFGAALQPTLLRAMTFMIVASPCAVVLATMPPYLAAIANAGRHGVLVKSAIALEQLGDATQLAFDKTGTLTRGVPRVARTVVLGPVAENDVIALAAAAERASEHPIGRAVLACAAERGLAVPHAQHFTATPGMGVAATVDGRRVTVARPQSHAARAHREVVREHTADLEAAGLTVVAVSLNDTVAGVLGLADDIRPDAPGAVASLQALTERPAVLLTGDNPRAAAALGAEVGITDLRAGLLPVDKVQAVEALRASGSRVVVVGDGVNDAPALAAAHVGVAMGRHGSDLALETADVVVVRDELAALPPTLSLARRARRVVRANLAFATLVIAALVGVDLVGHLPLPLGVAGHEGSTVVVGLNGLRLLRQRHWRG